MYTANLQVKTVGQTGVELSFYGIETAVAIVQLAPCSYAVTVDGREDSRHEGIYAARKAAQAITQTLFDIRFK
jgi:hypothetical protein